MPESLWIGNAGNWFVLSTEKRAEEKSMSFFNPFPWLSALLMRGMNGIMILAAIFWIWVLVDCLTKEPAEGNDRIAWLLVILLAPFIGALLYYFIRRPERIKAVGR
jgi:sterol desaturase/sphingolipid hydroxylase (fatty acid hydroxylase superfamily)